MGCRARGTRQASGPPLPRPPTRPLARADSQQYHNHYEVQSVDMTVNGAHVTYTTDGGIVVE